MLSPSGRGAILAGSQPLAGAILRRLAGEGVGVALIHSGDPAAAQVLLDTVQAHPERHCLIEADLSIEEQAKRAVADARKQLGDLSFSIHLGTESAPVALEQLVGPAWDAGMLAAKASYLLTLHAGLAMMSNEGPTRGQIIEIVPEAVESASPELLPQLTARASISFMTRAFALELSESGVLVNALIAHSDALEAPVAQDELAELIVTMLRLETVTGEELRVDGRIPAEAKK